MKNIYYFLKWNLNGMESYTKRILAYLLLGGVLSFVWQYAMGITCICLFVDFLQDIIRSQYRDFKREQEEMLNDIKG